MAWLQCSRDGPFRHRRTISLSWKLTGFFVAFGLILGYCAYIAYGAVSTRVALKVAAAVVNTGFESSFGSRNGDTLQFLTGAPNESLRVFSLKLPFLDSGDAAGRFTLYCSPRTQQDWLALAEGPDGRVRSEPAPGRMARVLDRLGQRGEVVFGRRLAFLSGEALPALLSLGSGEDGTRWAAGVVLDETGIIDFLYDNGQETAGFIVALLALSLVLGRLFAKRFTRPLTMLAAEAEAYGAGRGRVSSAASRRDEIGVLARSLASMSEEIDSRRAETEARLHSMVAMNLIDKAVLTTSGRTELLERVAVITADAVDVPLAAVALRDETGQGWNLAAVAVWPESVPVSPPPDSDGRAPALAVALRQAEPVFIPYAGFSAEDQARATGYYETALEESPEALRSVLAERRNLVSGRVASCPLYAEGVFLGVLVAVDISPEPFGVDRRRVFGMLADQAAVALRSILDNEAREDNFLGIIKSLTRAIDAKSRWTAGHSERVAERAVLLGRRLRLDDRELAMLRIAGLLHDVGKLGVPEQVLDKPGRLEDEEFALIRRHPELGGQILADIRSFEGVVPAVLHHHERWDGKGYPQGLAGKDIPLAARILAVSDVWDAITDDRPYRTGFPREEAVKFMVDGAGFHFDPDVLAAFLLDL